MARTPAATGDMQEALDRLRRMETRLTRFMEVQGFDTGVKRPFWKDDALHLPTDAVSVKDCLAVLPADLRRPCAVPLLVKGRLITTILVP